MQRQVGAAHREPGRHEHHHGEEHDELVGRRLDHDDAAGRADEPHQGALEPRDVADRGRRRGRTLAEGEGGQ